MIILGLEAIDLQEVFEKEADPWSRARKTSLGRRAERIQAAEAAAA